MSEIGCRYVDGWPGLSAQLLNVANVVAPGDQQEPGDSSFFGWNHGLTALATINKRRDACMSELCSKPVGCVKSTHAIRRKRD